MADSGNQSERLIRPAWLATAVLAGAALLLALWLRSGLIGGDQWPIRWLDVAGELERTSASQVRGAVAEEAGRGFFAVDLESVRTRVEALPWVARAEVSREWPDALLIDIIEHRPVARWNDDRLFSHGGELFSVSGSEGMQGLAQLRGPESRGGDVLERWQAMRSRLGSVGRDVVELSVDERGAWRAVLDNGVTLVLGREQVTKRLARYIGAQAALDDFDRPVRLIDMRYTNGLAVRWADAQTERDSDTPKGEEATHG
ncbi:cell division protein FtsQ/DivIB [Wenzhouxiangella sp. EGI_FJ10305]|uniref:cell division protein FtsQ/DivIB n=1 Tax=Wenzhouxiangella sp. EGI_FJ10305 TaxID=3243768 RepID=UPI0035DC5A15